MADLLKNRAVEFVAWVIVTGIMVGVLTMPIACNGQGAQVAGDIFRYVRKGCEFFVRSSDGAAFYKGEDGEWHRLEKQELGEQDKEYIADKLADK